MRTLLLVLSLFYSGTASHAQAPVDIRGFLDDPAQWDGQEILIEGFLTLEDYGKALFATDADYLEGRYEHSIPLVMPNNLLDVREAFERTWVRIRGVYDHSCARDGMFCSAHPGQGRLIIRELWGIRMPDHFIGWRHPVTPTSMDVMRVIEGERAERLMSVAGTAMRDIRIRDTQALVDGAHPSERGAFEAALANPNGRAQWLLFTGDYPMAASFEQGSPVGANLHYRAETYPVLPLALGEAAGDSNVAAVCICYEPQCSFRDAPQPEILTQRSFADPFICLPFVEIDDAWWLDTGFFIAMANIADYGGDLGTVVDLGNNAAAAIFTAPGLPSSHFVTAVRARPRPRVVDAIENERLSIHAYQMVNPDLTWVIERSGGRVRVRIPDDRSE